VYTVVPEAPVNPKPIFPVGIVGELLETLKSQDVALNSWFSTVDGEQVMVVVVSHILH
jgi:hypothetical protein